MGKPNDETTSSAPAATPAPAAAAAAPRVIKAEPGKPWPDPPEGGRWSRDPKTGDLTLIEASAAVPTPEQRAERREKQRAASLAAEANKNRKE